MPSDVASIRYVMPKFPRGYNLAMKTLRSSLRIELSDHAQCRLLVLEHGKKHGARSSRETDTSLILQKELEE
jgi:hypothetical protein